MVRDVPASVPQILAEHLGCTLDELGPEMPLAITESIDLMWLKHLSEKITDRVVDERRLAECRTVGEWLIEFQAC